MLSLTLPWPPSVNTYWRHVGPKVLISERGRAFRKIVAEMVMAGRFQKTIRREPMLGRLAVRIEASPPDARVRDIDNLLKAPLDALTHAGVWLDDGQVTELTIIKLSPRRDGGSIRVVISEAMLGAA